MELLTKAGLRRLAPTLLQPSLWADRFIKSPTALNLGRVTIPKFITGSTVKVAKGFTEAAIPSAIVTSQIEDDPNTRDIGLTNIERQIAAIKTDFWIGGAFGTSFEFLGPATKPFRQNVTRKVPGTIKDIANEALGGEFLCNSKGDSYLDDLAEGIYRLFDFDAAQIQYDRAVDLQQKVQQLKSMQLLLIQQKKFFLLHELQEINVHNQKQNLRSFNLKQHKKN